MIATIVSVLIVVFALAYQVLVGRKLAIGWPFAIASYVVWAFDMARTGQWPYVGAALTLTGICLYNWRKWTQAE